MSVALGGDERNKKKLSKAITNSLLSLHQDALLKKCILKRLNLYKNNDFQSLD